LFGWDIKSGCHTYFALFSSDFYVAKVVESKGEVFELMRDSLRTEKVRRWQLFDLVTSRGRVLRDTQPCF
jgi:hypothetical protein